MKYTLLVSIICFSLSTSAQSFGGESVEYDPVGNRFFSSSDGTSIVQRSSDGEISYFGTGLQADYGMEVMNNTLFAISGNTVYGYDLDSEMQVMSVAIPGAGFLNGMASDGVSWLWVTDFSAGRIHEIDVSDYENPVATVLVNNTGSTPNGIVYDADQDRLVFVNWGSNAPIKQVDLSNDQVSTIASTSLGNIDGIDHDGNGNFFISSWSPDRITQYDATFTTSEIVTVPGINNPADICYAEAIDTLAIPNGNGTVSFVGFSITTALDESAPTIELNVSPNPVSDEGFLSFNLAHAAFVNVLLVDMNGKEYPFSSGNMAAGEHRIPFSVSHLQAGNYILRLETPYSGSSTKLVVR